MSTDFFNHWCFLLELVFKFHKIIFVIENKRFRASLKTPRYEVMRVRRENGKVDIEFTDGSDQLSLFYKLQSPG
jgi:hypothetical protein